MGSVLLNRADGKNGDAVLSNCLAYLGPGEFFVSIFHGSLSFTFCLLNNYHRVYAGTRYIAEARETGCSAKRSQISGEQVASHRLLPDRFVPQDFNVRLARQDGRKTGRSTRSVRQTPANRCGCVKPEVSSAAALVKSGGKIEDKRELVNRSRFFACVAGTSCRQAKQNTAGHTVKSNYPPTKGPM
jgi:hypothetical protein